MKLKNSNINKGKAPNHFGGFCLPILLMFALPLHSQFTGAGELKSSAEQVVVSLQTIDHLTLGHSNEPEEFGLKVQNEAGSVPYRFEADGGVILLESAGPLSSDNPDKVCSIEPRYPSYELMIPEGKQVFVSFTEGNFYAADFSGDLQLVIEDGIVRLDHMQGDTKVQLNAGQITVEGISNTRIDAQTNLGLLQSDLGTKDDAKGKRQMRDVVGEPEHDLTIRAIMANISLKKAGN